MFCGHYLIKLNSIQKARTMSKFGIGWNYDSQNDSKENHILLTL